MAAQNLSRKRPAPGAEPIGYSQPMQQPVAPYNNASLGPQLSNDEFLQWGQAPAQLQNTYQDPSGFNVGPSSYPQNNIPLSNQLARRPVNQLATRQVGNNAPWVQDPNPAAMNGGWEDDVDELEQKAQIAKRDSAAKRKQIPPFVLKLRSFVEDDKNNDLIRWTEDGKSFVVLDEDEFAKKLIPELFKHNNYASFVRQLNMYGFHKKVGLSDNSMRASERKSKSPSEYSNPYFRRGYPDLMWLIQKPKNITSSTKSKGRIKTEGDNIEEGEETLEETNTENRNRPRPQLTLGDGSTNSLTQETLQNVSKELQLIRRQQAQISAALGALKREHEQLYGQAMSFQDQHTRHENSINAILTFLATIYTRSVSGTDAVQGIANILNGAIPQDSSKSGTVVDVGDYNFEQFPGMDDMGTKPFKRPQLLLTDGQNRATTMSPGSTSSPVMRGTRQNSNQPNSTSQIQEVFDSNSSEANNAAFNQNSRANIGQQNQQDMMSMIENINARNAASPNTPVADFTSALNDLEHSRGHTPLSMAQREKALRMINNRANQSGDNALINSNPPVGPTNFDRRLTSTKAELDALAKMQAQQDESVEKLTNLLQPLSPSGSIPGIHDNQSIPPPQEDIDEFLRHNEYFTNYANDGNDEIDFSNGNADGTFNWDAGDAGDADDDELFADVDNNNNYGINNGYGDSNNYLSVGDHSGGRVESVASSEATTPKTGVGEEEIGNRGKGRKLSTNNDDSARKRRKS